jgi:SSS family solute:Na+ symporter
VKDIMKRESVRDIRITVAVIGAIAIVLAVSGRGDIMSLLTGAYSVYTPGVIFPLLVAILSYRKNGVRPALWISAVIVGGLFGIAGTYFGNLLAELTLPQMIIDNLTLIGMMLSLLLSLISVKWSSQNKMSSEEEQ